MNEENVWVLDPSTVAYGYKRWLDNDGRMRKEHAPNIGVIAIYYDENGYVHRICGAAKEFENSKEWWYHGTQIDCRSQEEFERWLRLKAFW